MKERRFRHAPAMFALLAIINEPTIKFPCYDEPVTAYEILRRKGIVFPGICKSVRDQFLTHPQNYLTPIIPRRRLLLLPNAPILTIVSRKQNIILAH